MRTITLNEKQTDGLLPEVHEGFPWGMGSNNSFILSQRPGPADRQSPTVAKSNYASLPREQELFN